MESDREQQAVVRALPDEDTLTISIALAGQQRLMCRAKDEPLEKTFGRILANLTPKAKKQKKGRGAAAERPVSDVEIGLFSGSDASSRIPETTPNKEAWVAGGILKVGSTVYNVIVNPPTLEKVSVQKQAIVGIPVCAIAVMNFADESACTWQWAREAKNDSEQRWENIEGAAAKVYTPAHEDIGLRLKVTCTPGRTSEANGGVIWGEPSSAEVEAAVKSSPDPTAGAERHRLSLEPLQPPGLRIVTYNILADQYVGTEFARKVLFAACPQEFLEAEYRRPLILQELLGFHADIICLQEVDEKAFSHYFQPQLEFAGFGGFYTNKAGASREGSATFFRQSRFKALVQRSLNMKEIFTELWAKREAASVHSQLLPFLQASSTLRRHLRRVSTIAQITVLAPLEATESSLCVVNTHLFFHPRANHIRTLHTAAMLVEAEAAAENALRNWSGSLRGQRPAVVFCGDLNSGHNKGIPGNVELLATGNLPKSYWDWSSGKTFRYVRNTDEQTDSGAESDGSESGREGDSERDQGDPGFTASDLALPLQLAPADGLQSTFTNFVKGYQGALDYVWYEPSRMAVRREIPLPSANQLVGWIPSRRFPSDHLSVVFELDWREQDTGGEGSEEQEAKLTRHGFRSAANLRVFKAEEKNLHHGVIALHNRGVVAIPTDTLYGLAGSAECDEAIRHIYAMKRRPNGLPLAICVAGPEEVARYAATGHLPDGLLASLLPGPVTVVLLRKARCGLADSLNAGVATIGIRVPDSSFVRALCRYFKSAIALTSANISGHESPLRIEDFQEIWPQCAAIYDAGPIPASPLGSTVIDLSTVGSFTVLRAGVAEEQTRKIISGFNIEEKRS